MQCDGRALAEGGAYHLARLSGSAATGTHWRGPNVQTGQHFFGAVPSAVEAVVVAEPPSARASRSRESTRGRFFFVHFDHESIRSPSTFRQTRLSSLDRSSAQALVVSICERRRGVCIGTAIPPTGSYCVFSPHSSRTSARHAADAQGPRGAAASAITIAAHPAETVRCAFRLGWPDDSRCGVATRPLRRGCACAGAPQDGTEHDA